LCFSCQHRFRLTNLNKIKDSAAEGGCEKNGFWILAFSSWLCVLAGSIYPTLKLIPKKKKGHSRGRLRSGLRKETPQTIAAGGGCGPRKVLKIEL
jgi:hypothetical protein